MTGRRQIPLALRLGALLVLVAALVAGCDSGDSDAVEIEDLNAAVQAAAQAVLDVPGFVANTVYYDESETATGFDWLDFRSSGEYASVFHVIDPAESLAVLQGKIVIVLEREKPEFKGKTGGVGRQSSPPATAQGKLNTGYRSGRPPAGASSQCGSISLE